MTSCIMVNIDDQHRKSLTRTLLELFRVSIQNFIVIDVTNR
jgi:hypothetical protein